MIGCGQETSTTSHQFVTPVPETPMLCDDEMGVNNGALAPNQISVSSELETLYSKEHLKLDDRKAWQPLTNSPTEFVQFDFLQPRNLTGTAI